MCQTARSDGWALLLLSCARRRTNVPRFSLSGAGEDGMMYINTYRREVVGSRSLSFRGNAVGFGTELGDAVKMP